MQFVPLGFVIRVQKGAFCGLQNTPKSVFGWGSALDLAGGADDAPPDRLVGWIEDTPSSYTTPLGTNPPSALAMRPPEFQPDLPPMTESNQTIYQQTHVTHHEKCFQ